MKKYAIPERNYDRVENEELRKKIDDKFNSVHDELSTCFYEKKPFRNYGVLNRERFNSLHALIFMKRDVAFDEENKKLPKEKMISERKYDSILDKDGKVIGSRTKKAKEDIESLKKDGFELEI